MLNEHEFQLFLLKQLVGIGNKGLLKIYQDFCKQHHQLTDYSVNELAQLGQVKRQYHGIFNEKWLEIKENLDDYYELYLKTNFLGISNEKYPLQLLESYNPPIGLFYQGDISLLKTTSIGIVGARDFSSYGKRATEKIVADLVSHTYTIVSGLALGIDSIAHQTTINHKGKTIAVIGNGLGVTYPKKNALLQKEIGEKHLLLSEYQKDTGPRRHQFPMRNRIIAGLSRGICVIEAKQRSGSLITAQLALDEGREVFAVPGDIFSLNSVGCHELIHQGAKCVWDASHIIEEIKYH